MKAIKRIIRKASKAINAVAKDYFAGYIIVDSYGTKILCWTYAGAHAWLAYCSGNAAILETYDGAILAQRVIG